MKKQESHNPIMIFTLDTETRGLFGEVFRVGMYNGEKYWVANTFEECYKILKQYTKNYEVHVYIHNLDFDLSKIANTIIPDVDLNRCIFIEHNVAVFGTVNNIILHDSLKLIPSSLDKICKDFGLGEASKIDLSDYLKENGYKDKGDYFMRVDPLEPMLNLYLKFDCTSLHTVITQLIEISELTVEEFIKCPTTASLALKVYKENYPDDYKDVCSSNYNGEFGRFMEDVLRQAYYGGRTEVFMPELNQGFHMDVNSLYPYIMKVNEFPIGWYDVTQNQKAADTYEYWKHTHQGGGFVSCFVHVPDSLHIPPLPYRAIKDKQLKGKLIFPTGFLHGTWTMPELEMAEKVGCKIDRIEQVIYYPKTYPVFKEFVEQFEMLKRTSTGAKRMFAKLMQNSLYGKFGMRRMRRSLKDISELEKYLSKDKEVLEIHHPDLGIDMIQVVDEVQSNYIQVHIAAYVTSLARILLYEGLTNPEHGEVAYCDTDSIACSKEFAPELIHESEYGKWKLENVIKYGIFLQPKLYMEIPDMDKMEKEFNELFNDQVKGIIKKYGEINFREHYDELITTKAKGIPYDIRKQFTADTYQEILAAIKEGKEKIMFFGTEDSLFNKKVPTRRKFVSMFINGFTNGENWDTPQFIKKGMNLRAKQKRIMDYDNNKTYPHHISDWGYI